MTVGVRRLLLGIYTIFTIIPQVGYSQKFDSAFRFGASYLGDGIQHIKGEIQRNSTYRGIAGLHIEFSTQRAGLWNGGSLYLDAVNTHGSTSLSSLYTGAFQTLSNIETGNYTCLQGLRYEQTLGAAMLIVGLQDLNAHFASSDNSKLFINSSFGIPPSIPANIPAPIFPFTSMGIVGKWELSERFVWSAALFNAASNFLLNPYNLPLGKNDKKGLIVLNELQQKVSIGTLPSVFKLGAYYYNHCGYELGKKHRYGFYAIVDQQLANNGRGKILTSFLQLALNPESQHNHHYIGAGLCYSGFITKRANDALGVAFAHAGFKTIRSETIIELNYKAQLTANIFMQPDIQYIINPAGATTEVPNALVGILRLGVAF